MRKPSRVQTRYLVLGAVAVAGMVLSACGSSSGGTKQSQSGGGSQQAGQSSTVVAPKTTPTSTKPTAPPARQVHISLLNSDGSTYGVGMPVIAYFSKRLTSAAYLQKYTTVTVNGTQQHGAWYFETSDAGHGPYEAHFRLQNYWPAHSRIHVAIPMKGKPAGKGFVFNDSLTLDFRTGAAHISVVNDATHKMTVTSDGKQYGTFPVSLGASNTPTAHGTKVIMEKGASICMSGPGYSECGVKWTQRLTYGGEYLHSAPWNISNINNGVDSSNGCTNLLPNEAEQLYHYMEVGDVVQYPNANGPAMSLGAGYGDWNVDWTTWQTGGLVPSS